MSKQDEIVKDFLLPDLREDGAETYLQKIRNVASQHRRSQLNLKKMEMYGFTVGCLAETAYRDEPGMLEEWEQFYLPDHMFMEVIGVLEKFPCNSPYDELVLMVCEDGKVFGYEGNRLHLISNNLRELFEHGLQFPGIKQYYRGQSFEDVMEGEWEKVNRSEEVMEMRKEHQETLKSMKDTYLTNLDIIMGRKQEERVPAAVGGDPVPVAAL